MSLPARRVKLRDSMRARISPTSFRSTASGLIRMSERSTAIGGRVYTARRLRLGGRTSNVGNSTADGSTGVSQYGQTCQSASSGALQLTQACFNFVVQTGQTRHSVGTSAGQTGQYRPRRD